MYPSVLFQAFGQTISCMWAIINGQFQGMDLKCRPTSGLTGASNGYAVGLTRAPLGGATQ